MTEWSKNDALFFAEAAVGDKWEKKIAAYIQSLGHPVTTQPLRFRQDISKADEFGDQVDIEVYGRVLEVKSRDLKFETPRSYNYPTVIVDTVKGWNRKVRKPAAYIIVSQKTGSFICVSGKTRGIWKEEERTDGKRDIRDRFFMCPREKCHREEALALTLNKIRNKENR